MTGVGADVEEAEVTAARWELDRVAWNLPRPVEEASDSGSRSPESPEEADAPESPSVARVFGAGDGEAVRGASARPDR